MNPIRITQWRKSTYSNLSPDNCVEVGFAADSRAVRDTKVGMPGPMLVFSTETWRAFLDTAVSDCSR